MSILDSRHGVGGVLANGMRIAFGDGGEGIRVVEATSDSGMNITCFTDCQQTSALGEFVSTKLRNHP
jgi:hypothetical protein